MNYSFVPSCQIDHESLNKIYLKVFGYKTNGFFVEVGAYTGYEFSNTYELSKLGWGGLYIEPVPHLLNQCKINHSFNSNIQYFDKPIGQEYENNVPFYVGDWASTLKEEVVAVNAHLNKNNYFLTEVVTLNSVLEKFNIPILFDLLVVDTEGNDLEVMYGFNILKYCPKLIIIEYNHKGFEEFEKYFNDHGYRLIFKDSVNLIYTY